jgi:hypothetical protein
VGAISLQWGRQGEAAILALGMRILSSCSGCCSTRPRQRVPLHLYTQLHNYTTTTYSDPPLPPFFPSPLSLLRRPEVALSVIVPVGCGRSLAKVFAPASALVVLPGLALLSSLERGQRQHFEGIRLPFNIKASRPPLSAPCLFALLSASTAAAASSRAL